MVGAGFAGCASAHALVSRGWHVTLLEAGQHVGSGASGNRRCVVKPHQTRDDSPLNHFWSDAFLATRATLARLAGSHRLESDFSGVLQLLEHDGPWANENTGARVTRAYASQLAGIPVAGDAIYYPLAGWVNGKDYCQALISATPDSHLATQSDRHARTDSGAKSGAELGAEPVFGQALATTHSAKVHCVTNTAVSAIRARHPGWQVDTHTGQTYTADALIITTGAALLETLSATSPEAMANATVLPLKQMHGTTVTCQSLHQLPQRQQNPTTCPITDTQASPAKVITGKGYLISDPTGCTVGASYAAVNTPIAPSGNSPAELIGHADAVVEIMAKIDRLSPGYASKLVSTSTWAGTRLTTPDRLPVVGAVPDFSQYAADFDALRHGPLHQVWPEPSYHRGLYVLGGLGSRGAVSAALAADLLADLITGSTTTEPLSEKQQQKQQHYLALMHPARFLIRQLRKQR